MGLNSRQAGPISSAVVGAGFRRETGVRIRQRAVLLAWAPAARSYTVSAIGLDITTACVFMCTYDVSSAGHVYKMCQF